MYYAGIGSRETPESMRLVMKELARKLEEKGWILRSGGADGADSAFESGVTNPAMKEIYLPWKGFQDNPSDLYDLSNFGEAEVIAKKFHKGYNYLSQGAQKLMTRNTYQVLGKDLNTPVRFLICWTPDGCQDQESRSRKTGGTGQAISIAESLGIPVFNLANEKSFVKMKEFIYNN